MFIFSKPLSDYSICHLCCISSFSSLTEPLGYFVFKSKHISVINIGASEFETDQSDQRGPGRLWPC